MQVTQWKEPALNWNGAVAEEGQASILEIRSDQFIPDFLQAMGTEDPAGYFNQHRIDDDVTSGDFLKLFQPLHGCYYLVAASLVCRQLGLPDKNVNKSGGESVFFVIRRKTGSDEEAWIPTESGGYWKKMEGELIYTLAEGEERLPLHAVKVCPRPETPHSIYTDNIERDLYYGYIPTGNRDKYKDTYGRTVGNGTETSSQVANDFITAVENEYDYDFRKDLFLRRVYMSWDSLRKNLSKDEDDNVVLGTDFGTNAQTEQLYMILELGEFLQNQLPTMWDALEDEDPGSLPGGMNNLYLLLTNDPSLADDPQLPDEMVIISDDEEKTLAEVIDQYKAHFPLLRGQGNIPDTDLDFTTFTPSSGDTAANLQTLRTEINNAVDAETEPIKIAGGENSELVRLIQKQVQPRLPAGSEPVYVIRTVYDYAPDDPFCPPVVSTLPTRPFELAKAFDPDAPARLVRLEAPSIKPRDLRKYARGVGIEMSPELHKLASCMGGEDAQDVIDSVESCDSGGGLSIQMICTFSIQIIFLVAFIVMFIFLIALNFIFYWLAYLRICLPIPTKS